ncbi:hypothetical protein [Stenotrophomonas sp.]|uniref:hypothetical protein n=1 Tax=Stenotrophomonas sp. TaxID=69392 RepID=UPI0028AB890A|nr:hypothetical protein [Stenotrophomonas sp.]
MASYSISDAVKALRPILDRAPPAAVRGEWTATTEQAGVSSQSGGYLNAAGGYVDVGSDAPSRAISAVVSKLEASPLHRFNSVTVHWTRSRLPLVRGRVTVEASFDPDIVPRGPHDPAYDAAAAARRAFWSAHGQVADTFAAERGEANVHRQTAWFGPHRRILAVGTPAGLTLATDGLSTPWAGIPDRENGVGCELFLELDAETLKIAQQDDWAHALIGIGDLVADGYAVARDVHTEGAILFCRLTEAFEPLRRVILSRDGRQMPGLPFGPAAVIRVTPVAEAEIEGLDASGEWPADAALRVLAARGRAVPEGRAS